MVRYITIFLTACLPIFFIAPYVVIPSYAEEYSFDLSEIEKKPYHLGGHMELKPYIFMSDKDARLYKLRYYNRNEGDIIDEYHAELQLEGGIEKGITRLFVRTNTDYNKSHLEESQRTAIYEGYLSLKPSSSITIDIGKKTFKWGKGYAWNPAAFIDRPKNPDDPELSLEGFIAASGDYIKSFDGQLKTVSFTPVLIPVYEQINDSFGEINRLNLAGRLYLLLYDTDIDFNILTGGSKTPRYGMDFSRNIATNFETHGEFAFIDNFKKRIVDRDGGFSESEYDAVSYLIGIRYLTEKDTTYIAEYYQNETGFTSGEMRDYFLFIDKGYNSYISSGSDAILKRASSITEGSYGRINPMKDYLYLRISQKEPFDILYFTPSITGLLNITDRSYSLIPEFLYTAVTNLELRLRAAIASGERLSEYGEKPSDYRIEFRARYYF